MDYAQFKTEILEKTPETENLLYTTACMWLHTGLLPLKVIGLGNVTDRVIRIPGKSIGPKVVQSQFGPHVLPGDPVRILSFSRDVFAENRYVTDIILHSNICEIPTGAFQNCTSLERITIPKTVTLIGEATFKGCGRLQDVYYEGSEKDWKKVEIVHRGSKVTEGEPLGLYTKIIHFDIPGNEPLLGAKIHFNCDFKSAEEGTKVKEQVKPKKQKTGKRPFLEKLIGAISRQK